MTTKYLSYPQGDGNPDCKHCRGRGVRQIPKERMPKGALIPETEPCPCVRLRDIRANMDRGWKGLSRSKLVEESPLLEYIAQDLWVTCTMAGFRGQLGRVALEVGRKNPRWFFRVITDVDLMNAWLSKGIEVMDADVDVQRRQAAAPRFTDLVDLVEPPGLLIIRLGVKAARNVATPEVLLEALNHRAHIDKPTWIVDQPFQRLLEGHISWDQHVEHFLDPWGYLELESEDDVPAPAPPPPRSAPNSSTASPARTRKRSKDEMPTGGEVSLGGGGVSELPGDDGEGEEDEGYDTGTSSKRSELDQYSEESSEAENKKRFKPKPKPKFKGRKGE